MRLEPVSRLDDPRVAVYRDVRDAHLRAREGLFLAEGRLNVKRLITASRYRTHSVFVSEAALAALQPHLGRLAPATPVYVASRRLLCEVVGYAMHRGCVAAGERGPEPSLDALLWAGPSVPAAGCAGAGRPRMLLVIEDVSNAENVGALFRNALAFGVDGVVLTRGSVDPLYRRAIRVSMGASLRIPHARAADAAALLPALRAAGYTSWALCTGRDALPLARAGAAPPRLALWVGCEGAGLSPAARGGADARLTIAMAPGADSLNVATACGIALHHFQRPAAPE